MIFFIIYLIVGALFVVTALLWAPAAQRNGIIIGISSGFLVTGLGGLVLSSRLLKNPRQAEQIEIAKTEERTQFLSLKIHSALYFLTIIIVAIGTLAAEIAGYRDITLALSVLLIIEVILYVIIATYYIKKILMKKNHIML